MKPYFTDVAWIRQGTDVALSLTPKSPFWIDKEPAWNSIYRELYGHPTWMAAQSAYSTSYKSMYNQFVCHADFARSFKTPWNIEPYKVDKGYWGFVGNLCN